MCRTVRQNFDEEVSRTVRFYTAGVRCTLLHSETLSRQLRVENLRTTSTVQRRDPTTLFC
jgi:hypothetical protein